MNALFDNGLSSYAASCAILLFVGGAWLFTKRIRLAIGERAQGEVTGYVTGMRTSRGSRITQMPKVQYGSLEHGEQEFVSRMSADPERWPVGTRLPVAYSPSDPSAAEIATFARLWLAPLAFWLLAGGLIIMAIRA